MKMKQKDAVRQALLNVCGEQEGAFTPSKEQRAQVNQVLFEGFKAGSIELSKTYDDKGLKSYVSGLQSNWLRKDKELNGGVQYQPKNPGSRTGQKDPQIVAMRMLQATQTDPARKAEIQEFIDKRNAEIKPVKSVTLTEEQIQILRDSGLEHLVG